MSNKNIQKYQKTDMKLRGYSDYRLQPMYLLFTGLFFLAWPIFGQFAAFLIISVPAFMIAIKVAQLQARDVVATAEYMRGINDLYYSLAERDYNFKNSPALGHAPKTKVITKKSERPAYVNMRTTFAR